METPVGPSCRTRQRVADGVPIPKAASSPAASRRDGEERDLALRDSMQRLDFDELMPDESGTTGQASQSLRCLVEGCASAAGGTHLAFPKFARLRKHVDSHLLSVLPGLPPSIWMDSLNMGPCSHCTHLVSRRRNGGLHHKCLA